MNPMEPQPNKPVIEDDETQPVEEVTLKDIADSLRETGSKLRSAVLFPLWKMARAYLDGTTGAVDGLSDGLQGKKKPVEVMPEPKPEPQPVVAAVPQPEVKVVATPEVVPAATTAVVESEKKPEEPAVGYVEVKAEAPAQGIPVAPPENKAV